MKEEHYHSLIIPPPRDIHYSQYVLESLHAGLLKNGAVSSVPMMGSVFLSLLICLISM